MVTVHSRETLSVGASQARSLRRARGFAFEAAGVFTLVFAVGVAVEGFDPAALLAVGIVLPAMARDAARHLTGAHYNPAVTLALVIRRHIAPSTAIASWTVQGVFGLLAAVLAARAVDPAHRGAMLATMAMAGWPLLAIAVVLMLFTVALCAVVLRTGDVENAGPTTSLHPAEKSIALVTASAAAATGAIGYLSQVTSIAPAVTDVVSWPTVAIWLVAQMLVGLAAGVGFLTLPGDLRDNQGDFALARPVLEVGV